MSIRAHRRQLAKSAAVLVLALMSSVGEALAQDFPLFVTDYRGIGVYSLDAAGTVVVVSPLPGPLNSVRNDRDGNLYTCNETSTDVTKIDPAGSATVFVSGLTGCFGLLFAADGTLYVSNVGAGRIEVVPPEGGSFTTLVSGLVTPMHMAFTSDGSIVVAEHGAGRISRVSAAGAATPVATGLALPVGVAVGAADNIYVSELRTGQLLRIDPAGNVSVVAVLTGAGPTGLDFHSDGRLFVAEFFAGQIAMVDIATGNVDVFRNGLIAPVGLSFQRTYQPLVRRVTVDLKPGSVDNPVNPKSRGVVPVAILGSTDFDVSSIDPATVRFGVSGVEAAPVHSHLEDVNGDGLSDLVFHFATRS